MKNNQLAICDYTVFRGRNIYSHRPVIKLTVDIGKYGDIPTNEIPGFNDKLLELLPGLKTNCCSTGYAGGFVDRLNEGTYLGHVLEHVILELQFMVGYDIKYGKTRTIEVPSLYYLVYEYENEVCALECGKAAVFILNHLLEGKNVTLDDLLPYLKKVSAEAELGPGTSAIVNEAKKRGIPVMRIGNESLVRLGYGKFSRLIEATLTDATSCIAADISCNKQLTKYLLNENKIPIPYGKVVYSEISALMAARQIGPPVVIKPFNGNHGKGVHLNLNTEREIRNAYRDASKTCSGIIVEKFMEGSDYRVLVIGGKISAAAKRIPACVTGDGIHTIAELTEIVNADPRRGEDHQKPLTKICIDSEALNLLRKNGLSPESVLPEGQVANLRENGNISTGGTAIDCTDIIHPDNAELAIRAAEIIGIDIAGIDIVTKDISQSLYETSGAIVEVNTAPGIRMHLYPSEGKARNVASDIVELLFPGSEAASFPVVSVTGTNGKTTVVRLIQHVLMGMGKSVGMTGTSGTYVNKKCVCRGDNSGPRSARLLLSNKNIDAAVLETARGGIIRDGLGYDLADVGVITNISGDHLGLDGVETLDDLIHVKSLVAEAVKKDGCVVLNGNDPTTDEVLERVRVRVILFYMDKEQPSAITRPGCTKVYYENGCIFIADGEKTVCVSDVSEIPITLGGKIRCNIENALTAVASLYALNVPVETIKAGLKSFTDNSGRFSFYRLNGFTVMLDYGHNPEGYRQALGIFKSIEKKRLIGIIGMPGDRTDASMYQVGDLCSESFDKIIIKEDNDLRGRKPGEVAGILRESILSSNFPKEDVAVIENEVEALDCAVKEAEAGDIIVEFYEKLSPLQDYLEKLGAEKLSFDIKGFPLGEAGA